jgi:hypothetical protein
VEWQCEEDGNVRVSVKKMKALTVTMEKVILNGEGRESLTCFVSFFLADVLFLGIVLD